MPSEDIVGQVALLVERNKVLETANRKLEESTIQASKFYNVAMNTMMVATLHGVSMAVVRKYVHLGLIPTHPESTDAKLLVRGSVALQLDFDDLKCKAKYKSK